MENVHYEVADLEKAKKENNGLMDKVVEWGDGHSIEFTIKDDVLTLRTTKKTFTAPVDEITVTYQVENYRTTYYLKSKNGDKISFARQTTYIDFDEADKIKAILESLPGYKGRIKAQKIYLYVLIALIVLSFILYAA